MHDTILIIDFGSQYTQLIARRVRECNVYSDVYACDTPGLEQHIQNKKIKGIILSGGPHSVFDENSFKLPEFIFTLDVPILGVCYGMQALAQHFGGKVKQAAHHEYGDATIITENNSAILQSIEKNAWQVWMSHGDQVVELPNGFTAIASTNNASIAAFENSENKIYALQFHPEVTHTEFGINILQNFVQNICMAECNWTSKHIIAEHIELIQQKVGAKKVILGLSGGVDSSVVALLLHKAIGSQLLPVFVDNGLLRKNEKQQVATTFKNLGIDLITVDSSEIFLQALKGVYDPEQKRKIIGRTFVEVFQREANNHTDVEFLAQGTIYPDVIESAGAHTGTAKVIKSHHNVGGLPDTLKLKLVEPLRDLFKDEVRSIGKELGLPEDLIGRHPFPGPGLGVRVLGEVKSEYLSILRQADAIFIEILHKYNLYKKISQAFVVFIPQKTVGVVGDNRQYDYVVSLRAVETTDFMTATWARIPYEVLQEAASRIMNEVRGVARVTYDISSKPPATIEWE